MLTYKIKGGMNLIKIDNGRIAKNTMLLYIRMFLVLLITLYTTRVIINTLGIEDFGIYNVVCGFVSIFGFLNTSLTQGVQRFYSYEMGQQDGINKQQEVLGTSMVIMLIISIVLLLVAELLGFLWFEYKLVIPVERYGIAKWIFQFSIFSLIIGILQIPFSAMILAFEKMNYYAIVAIIDVLLKLLIVLILPYMKIDNLLLYGFLSLAISIVNFFMYYVYYKINFSSIIRLKFLYNKRLFKSMFVFSGWNTLGSFAFIMKGQGVNVLLNTFFGAAINAANGIATQVMSATQQFSLNVISAFKPQLIFAYSQNDYLRVTNMMYYMSKITFVLTYMVSIPILLETEYILKIWLDLIPVHAVTFTRLTIIAMLISNFNTPVTQVVHATGNMKIYQLVTGSIILSIIPLSWTFLKLGLSPNIVYYVTILIVFFNVIGSLIVLKRIYELKILDYLSKVIYPCALFAIFSPIASVIIHVLLPASFMKLFLVFMIMILFSIMLGYLIILNEKEKKVICNFFYKYYNRI